MKNTKKKGFTLVELVIVIAVIAILAGVMIGTFSNVVKSANISNKLQTWRSTVDEAYLDYVAEYDEVPTYVRVTTTNDTITFSFVNSKDVKTGDYKMDVESGTTVTKKYVELEKIGDTDTSVCLVRLNGGFKVVTGTITDTTLKYDNTDATLAPTQE